jgi:CMP-N,N'-diacetyllegionaminic acid synthase
MRAGKRILVVVPARGGSKGIPLKNLQSLAGAPLVAHAARAAAAVDCIDRAVVSTDHPAIRAAAMAAGLEAPFLRPASLSGDRIGDIEVLAHALQATEAATGEHFDVVLMLQPTSPLRDPGQVRAVLAKLVDEALDSVWTVSATDSKFHPLKQLCLDENGALSLWDPRGAAIVARQQLTTVYHRNGVAYALTRHCLLVQRSLLGMRAGAIVIEGPVANIDTAADLAHAESLLAKTVES